jgi:protein involved in temperature-dependent protein secretion
MAGEAEAPRVRPALPVHHDEVGRPGQHGERRHRHRHLAKREIARPIGEGCGQRRLGTLQDIEALGIEDDDGGEGGRAVPREVDVDAGDATGGECRGRSFLDLVAKCFLNGPRLG